MKDHKYQAQIDAYMDLVRAKNANEPEFLQAVEEVAETVIPFIEENPMYNSENSGTYGRTGTSDYFSSSMD